MRFFLVIGSLFFCHSNEGQTMKLELLIFKRKEVIRFVFTDTVAERRKRGIIL